MNESRRRPTVRRTAALAALVAGAVLAAAAAPGGARAGEVAAPLVLRAQLARLNAVEWRLMRIAAPACAAQGSGTVAGSGMALDSLAAYPPEQRAAVAAATGLSGGVDVVAVAPDSPAALAGVVAGDRLVAIGETALPPAAADPLAAPAADDALRALPVGVPAALVVERSGERRTLALTPQARCAARAVLVVDSAVDAYSDARNLAVTTGFMAFVANDDEIALIAGHELAHVVMDPQVRAQGLGSKRRERAADALGARFAECAGYDLARASGYWARYDGTKAFGFLPTATHPMSRSRRLAVAALAGRAECAALATGAIAAP